MEEHYWEMYMGRHGYCLPTHFQLNQQFFETAHYFPTELPVDPVTKEEIIAADDFYHIPVNGFYQRGEEVQRDIGKETGLKFKDRNEALQRIAQLPGADLPGYMPLREDFEVEYENDAEVMLADMEFSPDDHPSEVELKLQVIRIYNTKLAERDRRKRFVIDRGFIDVKGQQAVSFALFTTPFLIHSFLYFVSLSSSLNIERETPNKGRKRTGCKTSYLCSLSNS